MTGVPIFDVAGVTYRYQAVTALDGLSLRIEAGKRVALLGGQFHVDSRMEGSKRGTKISIELPIPK